VKNLRWIAVALAATAGAVAWVSRRACRRRAMEAPRGQWPSGSSAGPHGTPSRQAPETGAGSAVGQGDCAPTSARKSASGAETAPTSDGLARGGHPFAGVLREAAGGWVDDKAPRQAAALSFYAMLALAPLLIIAVGIAGLVLGEGETQRRVLSEIEANAGPQVADAVETVLANASRPGASTTALVVGGLLLLFGASGAVRQLKGALNVIWNVERVSPDGLWRKILGLVLTYLRTFALVIVFGVGLLVLLASTAAWGWVAGRLHGSLPSAELLLRALDFGVTLALLTLVFAAVFKGLPDVEIDWRELWGGAFVTAVLFDVGRLGIGLYMSNSATTSAYGAAGSVVALLLWVYYSAMIVFFGAELTQVHARRSGRRLTPKPGARRV
jgi:membrane protein